MLKRLRIKFICINMAIVLAMLAVIFGLVIGSTQRNLEQESMTLMRSALGVGEGRRTDWNRVWDSIKRGGSREAPPLLPYIIVDLASDGSFERVEGYYSYSDSQSELYGLVETALNDGGETGVLSDWGYRYLRSETAMGTRLVFADMSSEQSTMRGLWRTCALIGAVSLAVFFVISLLLARWAVRPVEEAWRQQKQFVSDASHELKTPLTVIMTNAELLQSPDYDAAAKSKFSANILTMSHQMCGLVESLLELARVDNGAVETNAAELDFSRLCADAVLPFEPLCFEKGLTLQSDLTENIPVRGSESHLRQTVEILLDNAQKYADPDSEITVSLVRSGGKTCRLCVADRGAPISDEDLPHLFERFYRAEKARSRDGSYGLGLSIAQKIVEQHHGKIWAESKDGLNSFYITLPVIP